MSANTNISWADKTWNPLVGCEAVSPACDNCYAKTLHDLRHKAFLNGKLQNVPQYAKPFEEVQTIPDRLTDPLSWRAPQIVFVNSLSDVFHKDVPMPFIDAIMRTIALARRHTFMILTKRPARMRAYSRDIELASAEFREARIGTSTWPLPNLMLGVTVENQQTADQRIPMLLETPAALRFLSCEPLLGPVDLRKVGVAERKRVQQAVAEGYGPMKMFSWVERLDLVIAGGEQATNARPTHIDWFRSLRDQCVPVGTSFHFKQHGDYLTVYDRDVDDPDWQRCSKVETDAPRGRWLNLGGGHGFHGDRVTYVERVGAKRAGRELDGRTWNEFPTVPA